MPHLIRQQAQIFFEKLYETLESQCGDRCDIESYDGYLELTLPSEQVFLVNFHEPTQQIWLSSPFSGAHHYAFEEGEWRSTRGCETFLSRLSSELEQQLGQSVDLL